MNNHCSFQLCAGELGIIRAQLSLRRGGKKGFKGNICGQQFASKVENTLQHAASTFSIFQGKNELEIAKTHPWTVKRDD